MKIESVQLIDTLGQTNMIVTPTLRVQQDSESLNCPAKRLPFAETVAFFKIPYRHDKVGK